MSSPSISTQVLPLTTGATIPQIGLGVWQTPAGATTREAVLAALRFGYRHIDTAAAYRNEADVGAAIRDSGIPRDQIFVTTKLWNDDQGFDSTLRAFDASAQRLGLEAVDLYLIHWPVAGKRLDSWRALERLHRDRRARAIGVSNYLVPHLEELLTAASVPPAVNQIELSPFLQRQDTVVLCAQHGIVVEAYSPLTRARRFGDPTVRAVAAETGRSPAQVLIRWSLQRGFVVLPKSVHAERIAENGTVFDFALSAAQMQRLDALDESFTTGWDPATQR